MPICCACNMVLWTGTPIRFSINLLWLVSSGRVRVKPTITHVLDGIESVPKAFEITANKGKYKAINPAQVMIRH